MPAPKPFNGYKSWNRWNVSLWLNNEESLYNWARDLARAHGVKDAARIMASELKGQRTPDGAVYNLASIRDAIDWWTFA